MDFCCFHPLQKLPCNLDHDTTATFPSDANCWEGMSGSEVGCAQRTFCDVEQQNQVSIAIESQVNQTGNGVTQSSHAAFMSADVSGTLRSVCGF